MAGTGFILIVVTLCLQLADAADLTFDYHKVELTGAGEGTGFEVVVDFKNDTSLPVFVCSRRGVIKLTFNNSTRRRAEIKVFFDATDVFIGNFNFHISDSPYSLGSHHRTENDQFYSAQVWSIIRDLHIEGHQKPGETDTYGVLYTKPEFMKGNLTINVSDRRIKFSTGDTCHPNTTILYYGSEKLFALNGQEDPSGHVDYNLYMGINRVVNPDTRRSGYGVCRVEVTWHSTLS